MIPPPPPPVPRKRRATITVVALLVVMVGAFVWGLCMFGVGHLTARARQSELDKTQSAAILIQLMHIDQALAQEDVSSATSLIDQLAATTLTMPDPQVDALVRVRRHQLKELELATALTKRLAASLQRRSDADLHLIAVQCVSTDGTHLLGISQMPVSGRLRIVRSVDSGHTWTVDEHFAPALSSGLATASFVFAAELPKELLLLSAVPDQRLGWWSHDAGATFELIPYPTLMAGAPVVGTPPPSPSPVPPPVSVPPPAPVPTPSTTPTAAMLCDGRVVLRSATSLAISMGNGLQACFWRSDDAGHTWKAGEMVARTITVIANGSGMRIVAKGLQGQELVSDDLGASYQPFSGFKNHDTVTALYRTFDEITASFGEDRLGRSFLLGKVAQNDRLRALPDGEHPVDVVKSSVGTRWYLLGQRHGLWRSDDDGRHWMAGRGILGQVHATCLTPVPAAPMQLLIGGDGLWVFNDQDDAALFGAADPVAVPAK